MKILRVVCCFMMLALSLSSTTRGQSGQYQTNKLSNVGTEFYFTFDPCYEESGINRLMLYIASSSDGVATIEVISKGFVQTVNVKANDIVPVELGTGIGQAFSKSTSGGIPPEQVYSQAAVHVTSTVPVVIYGVTRFSYTSDSFLALPVEALGTDYVVASMADMSWMYGGESLPSETAIVAAFDGTKVDFTLGGPSVTVSGGGMRPGQMKSFTMNKGDVWIIGNSGTSNEGDISGSVIHASKPVGVVSGNQCANVPTTIRWCDFISEMEMPMNTWGRSVLIPKYASRINGYFMKVFAGEANTKIFYNGSYYKTIQTVGGQEGRGFIYQRVDGSGNNVVSLTSDKPISVTVFNPGQEDDNISTDPFQMNVLPVEQFATSFLFCTPGSKGGVGFTRNFLGIIFELDSASKMPADLQFGTSVNGHISWRPLSAVFGPSFSTKDIYQTRINNKTYAFKECVLPGDNVYAVRCNTPLMCYSYGGSDYDSYGQPAGALALDLTKSDDMLKPTTSVTNSGTVYLGTAIDRPSEPSVRSNLSKIFLNYGSSNVKLVTGPIVGATTWKADWQLMAIDPSKDGLAFLTVSDRAGNDTTIEIHTAGTGVPPAITADGSLQLCLGQSRVLTCSNGFVSYRWSTGETTASITYKGMKEGDSSITVTTVTAKGDTLTSTATHIITNALPPQPTIEQSQNVLHCNPIPGLQYSWYLNGDLISAATSNQIIVTQKGLYRLHVVDPTTGCTSESLEYAVTLITDVATIDDEPSIELSPNPTKSSAIINLHRTKPTKIEVISSQGVVVLSLRAPDLQGEKQELDLSALSAGSYVVRIQLEGKTVIKKVVKE